MAQWRLEFSRAARRQTRCPVRSVSRPVPVRAGSHCNATASPHRRDHVTRTALRTRRARRRRRPAQGLPAAGCWRVGWGVRPRQKICTWLRMRWRTSATAPPAPARFRRRCPSAERRRSLPNPARWGSTAWYDRDLCGAGDGVCHDAGEPGGRSLRAMATGPRSLRASRDSVGIRIASPFKPSENSAF